MAEYSNELIAVVGPTASGKTAVGVSVCKEFSGEVVSCDSMQIYRGMDISTAKPTAAEMQGVPHHLIDFVSPDEKFSVAQYCGLAKDTVADIAKRGRLPVLVGGTGLYYSSLVDNISFTEGKTDFAYREFLKSRAESEGAQALLEELRLLDPRAAETLHVNNVGRIIRALEIYHSTGKTKTEQDLLSRSSPSPYKLTAVGLDAKNRDYLYDRINSRIDRMLESGLEEEARRFYEKYPSGTASQAIGCKELLPYFKGEASLDECVEKLKMQTRRYAKRQLTWFRRDERIHFFFIDEYDSFDSLACAVNDYIRKEREK